MDVGMELVLARGTGDATQWDRPAECARQDSLGSEKALCIDLSKGGLVFGRREMLFENSTELWVRFAEAKGTPESAGNEQIALDVAPAPRKELEAVCAIAGWRIRDSVIAVQDAQSPFARLPTRAFAEMCDRSFRLASTEDHGFGDDASSQRRL
jgi:hypothetical protein